MSSKKPIERKNSKQHNYKGSEDLQRSKTEKKSSNGGNNESAENKKTSSPRRDTDAGIIPERKNKDNRNSEDNKNTKKKNTTGSPAPTRVEDSINKKQKATTDNQSKKHENTNDKTDKKDLQKSKKSNNANTNGTTKKEKKVAGSESNEKDSGSNDKKQQQQQQQSDSSSSEGPPASDVNYSSTSKTPAVSTPVTTKKQPEKSPSTAKKQSKEAVEEAFPGEELDSTSSTKQSSEDSTTDQLTEEEKPKKSPTTSPPSSKKKRIGSDNSNATAPKTKSKGMKKGGSANILATSHKRGSSDSGGGGGGVGDDGKKTPNSDPTKRKKSDELGGGKKPLAASANIPNDNKKGGKRSGSKQKGSGDGEEEEDDVIASDDDDSGDGSKKKNSKEKARTNPEKVRSDGEAEAGGGDAAAKNNDAQKPSLKEKKSGFLAIFGFGKKKDEVDGKKGKDGKAKSVKQERRTVIADNVSELSDDIQKKLKKAKLNEEALNKEFPVLLNILHFLLKDSFRMREQPKDPPRERRPYANDEMMNHAKSLLSVPDNVKKYYRNIEFSGKGGFGRVFAAKDANTKKRVAIKRVPHVSEKDKRNNYCEIGFLSKCEHPNIVKFFKAWEVKDEAWIVTEFLEGGTLSEAVKVHQFSERHIAYVAREILKALKYLHSLNFVHRDLKSGNVMMSIEGHIKLIDFGLCCDVSEGPRTQMLGSPYWIPPEMIRKKPHGCPADIWSFAVCVLEMYLKEPPNAESRLMAMFTGATEGIKQCIPTRASPEAKEFLSLCLELNPKKRATAEQLLKHPFVTQPKLEEGIRDVLRGVFVSNSLALSGI